MEKHEKLKKMRDYVAAENKDLKFTDGGHTLSPEQDIAKAICDEETWSGQMAEEQAEAARQNIGALKNKFIALYDALNSQASAAEGDTK
jgi:hypothetical protein